MTNTTELNSRTYDMVQTFLFSGLLSHESKGRNNKDSVQASRPHVTPRKLSRKPLSLTPIRENEQENLGVCEEALRVEAAREVSLRECVRRVYERRRLGAVPFKQDKELQLAQALYRKLNRNKLLCARLA